MTIPIETDLLRELIKLNYNTINDFIAEWECRVDDGLQKEGKARNRSTLYEWFRKNGLPKSKSDVFGFAATLDIDPIGMLAIDQSLIANHFKQEKHFFLSKVTQNARFSVFWPLFSPGPNWPDNALSQKFYARNWHVKEFHHNPENGVENVFASVELISKQQNEVAPRVYHVAYKKTGAVDEIWRPYGTLIGRKGACVLLSESGDFQHIKNTESPNTLIFETFFGSGSADFRIASLHEFEYKLKVPSDYENVLRFK